MKKITLLFFLFLFLALTACSTAAQTDTDTTGTSAAVTSTNPPGDITNMQLVLGTFALEDTAYAITAEQAAELLPLWKAAQSLSESDTITAEEFQAVFNQIEDIMTTEQMDAITSMDLSQETMAAIGEKYGLTFGPGGGGGFDPSNLTEEQLATREAFQQSGQDPANGGGFPGGGLGEGGPPDGGFAGGGPGGGGFPGGGDAGSLPEAQQTAIASGTGRGGGNGGLPTAFYEAIIQFLEGKGQ